MFFSSFITINLNEGGEILDNQLHSLIIKKIIQKELINEMCNKGLIDFAKASNIIKQIDKNINYFKKTEGDNPNMKNIEIKIKI